MSKETGGPAFPCNGIVVKMNCGGMIVDSAGLTIRDYFAAKALSGMMANSTMADNATDSTAEWVAKGAYKMADAMLKARSE